MYQSELQKNIKSKLKLKIDQIDNDKFMLNKLQKEYESLKNEFISNSNLLSNSRRKSAINLSRKINDELPHLKLENANFKVQFEEVQFENASEMGIDKVTFLASTYFFSAPVNLHTSSAKTLI